MSGTTTHLTSHVQPTTRDAQAATGNEPHPGKIGDLQMLVISGGRERTEAEYRALLPSPRGKA